MGNTCKSMADSCQCMAKTTKYCKVISLQLIKINEKKIKCHSREQLFFSLKSFLLFVMFPKIFKIEV